MGQVHPLPATTNTDEMPATQTGATVRSIDSGHCGLCGATLSARALRYHVVSPQACETTITVCHTCHKAALGEGYRPAE
jgi:hypothetical protein